MIVYQSSKEGFLKDVLSNDIHSIIQSAYYERLGRGTSRYEVLSWSNSLMYMNNLLIDKEIPDNAGISIEFEIPLGSKRIDFIITGQNEERKDQVIIIELKQWSKAVLTDRDGIVRTSFHSGETDTTHPSYQAWSYTETLQNFSQAVEEENISLIPCAYLHNYKPDDVITNSFYDPYTQKAPVFLQPDAIKLREFIKTYVKYGDDKDILYQIENGRIRPSKQLADCVESMLKGNTEFVMIDDQKVAYEYAMAMAKLAKPDKKLVLIVEGGPGTGKSVVAINLLVTLNKMRMNARYVSKNAAPRDVYSVKLKQSFSKNVIDNLFTGSGKFCNTKANVFDALIVDEAHRLNLKSGIFENYGENQVLEIINAAKFSVFFVDDNQRIHIKDIGNKKRIEEWARSKNAIVRHLKLSSQFRCNGSDGYLAWIDNTLQINDTANIKLSQDDFDFRIFTDPNELRKTIEEKNKFNNKSRMVAGYCWDWKSKKDPSKTDVIIEKFNFGMKWNLSNNTPWIIGETSINEIGCIHTCQGLELDYVGVIVGDDIIYRNGKIVTQVGKRSGGDRSVIGINKLLRENRPEAERIAEEIIKNTYRTLMTRGMKGCYVYFCDKELEAYFQSCLIESKVTAEVPVESETSRLLPRVEPVVNDDVKYVDYLPLYSLKAACGAFGEWQVVDEDGWVKAEGLGKLSRNMFIVRAVGKSMEPRINDGDLCVFKAGVVGSRANKIVLVQHNDHYDSDNQGRYSIKKYTSTKKYDQETGEWEHERITLQPLNNDYEPIIIDREDGFMVIGEFVDIVKP